VDTIPGEARKLRVTDPMMTGADVVAAQHVLHDNRFGINFHPGKADHEYGPKTAEATRLAKFLLGYPDAEVNSEFGPRLYGYLVHKGDSGYLQRPSSFLARSVTRRKRFGSEQGIRGQMVALCRWAIANSDRIHFAETRPIPIDAAPRQLPLTLDCSGSTTLFAHWAHAPDPNGLGYNGQGSTMAMLAHLKRIPRAELQPGDLVVFDGDPEDQHVVVVLEPAADPVVESHGAEGGPLELTLSQVAAGHSGQTAVFLSLM
jgi:hypothetical protein